MPTFLENPADQLSTIVIRLFQLAGDTRIKPKKKRDNIFLAAHKLHGYSLALAQRQFTDNSEKYTETMDKIKEVNSGLKKAKDEIDKIVETIHGIGKLVSSVEKLLIAVGDATV
ncbi:MAG: hypothetical protein MRJ65_15475 [Candidatus Brocadiaceae bacterium]|nr:hypothetical protein [Candidatus Brocadiaceae bacterium]